MMIIGGWRRRYDECNQIQLLYQKRCVDAFSLKVLHVTNSEHPIPTSSKVRIFVHCEVRGQSCGQKSGSPTNGRGQRFYPIPTPVLSLLQTLTPVKHKSQRTHRPFYLQFLKHGMHLLARCL